MVVHRIWCVLNDKENNSEDSQNHMDASKYICGVRLAESNTWFWRSEESEAGSHLYNEIMKPTELVVAVVDDRIDDHEENVDEAKEIKKKKDNTIAFLAKNLKPWNCY